MKRAAVAHVSGGWRWPLVGLLVIVAFLAHDIAMAGHAHTAHSASTTPLQQQRDALTVEPNGACLTTSCVPPTACDIGQTLIRPAAGDGGGLDPTLLIRIAAPLSKHPSARVVLSATDGPTLPPDVHRAFLQVFLI